MEERHFKSDDGLLIKAWKSSSKQEGKAVVQLIHGSLEYSERYRSFIDHLNDSGYSVYHMDLRGHGKTAEENGRLNVFSEKEGGWELTVADLIRQREEIEKEQPGKSVYLMGHSMGSFLARDLASRIGTQYSGMILSGTGRAGAVLTYSGILLAKLLMAFKREKESAFLHQMVYGKLNDAFKNARTDYDFLSRDESVVDAYIADPLCGRIITPEYGHELASGVLKINRDNCYRSTPSGLPIYLFSGEEDPVGGKKGAFVREVAARYEKHGNKNISVKIWPGGRHEMLNETNRFEVYQAVSDWLVQFE